MIVRPGVKNTICLIDRSIKVGLEEAATGTEMLTRRGQYWKKKSFKNNNRLSIWFELYQ